MGQVGLPSRAYFRKKKESDKVKKQLQALEKKHLKKPTEKEGLKGWHIVLIILILFWLYNSWSDRECDLKFEVWTSSASCFNTCESKCYDEGFDGGDGYTVNYISYEGQRRQCECWCDGCR